MYPHQNMLNIHLNIYCKYRQLNKFQIHKQYNYQVQCHHNVYNYHRILHTPS